MTVLVINIFVQLFAGGLGGNSVQFMAKKLDLGFYGNSLTGLLGGWVVAQMVMTVFPGLVMANSLQVAALIAQSMSGFVGGAVFVSLLALIRTALVQ